MSQEEIIEVLKKVKRPLALCEIAKELNNTTVKVSMCIKRLERHNEIKIMEIDRDQALKNYNCKRRMRLYYI